VVRMDKRRHICNWGSSGTVVASQKQGKLGGLKLLMVQDMIMRDGFSHHASRGDTVGAGVGETC